jgi:transposase InsO family protein
MKGVTMLATLQRLGIAASFSRPSVSDDNAICEAIFRALREVGWMRELRDVTPTSSESASARSRAA